MTETVAGPPEFEPDRNSAPVPVLATPPPAELVRLPLRMAGNIAALTSVVATSTVRLAVPKSMLFWKSMEPLWLTWLLIDPP